jgi:general secretion pathway protein M
MEPLANLLHDVEYGQPFLFVDNLSLRRATSAPASGGAGRLQVHLLLRGYLQQPPASSAREKQPEQPPAPGEEPDA